MTTITRTATGIRIDMNGIEENLFEGYTENFTGKDGWKAKVQMAYDENADPAYLVGRYNDERPGCCACPKIFRSLTEALKYLAKEGYEWSKTTDEHIED